MPIPPMRLVALFVALTALTHPSFAQGRGGGRGGRTGGAAVAAASAPEGKRLLRVADMYNLRNVGGLQISPDGEWVLYTVSQLDSVRDRSQSDLYLARWDGSLTRRLTYSPDGEGSPRFSPDGRYVSFLSSRGAPRGGAQVWLLDRNGGEATKLTSIKGGISGYEWSPDATRLVLTMRDPDPEADRPARPDSTRAAPGPIVIDRYHFKQDGEGYLDGRRTHLYLYDIRAKKLDTLTTGPFDEAGPVWSPDGRMIAFTSERTGDPDRENDANIYVMEARARAPARQLTTFNGPDGSAAWSPDGSQVAYLQGSEARMGAYNLNRLAIVPAAGGAPRILTESLDRAVSNPTWTADGNSIYAQLQDDRAVHLARVSVADGAVTRVLDGRRAVAGFEMSRDGRIATIAGTASLPNEVYALENGTLRAITEENAAWLADVALGTTEDFAATGGDGTQVSGLMAKPPGYAPGTRYPTLLRIHGGPNSQDQHSFSFERQLFAANGYVVLAVNYRGSAGRGAEYQRAIFADWGNLEVKDLLAAVDHAVATGVADSTRLGIGGWSYGGILTDYTIATTTRFKAATSGAGAANWATLYGLDQYIYQYDTELGKPWEAKALYDRLSYPFWQANRIRTPTLFLGGAADNNVPVAGGEQMYMALKSQGIDTELIVYPNQNHGIALPSYQKDRYDRYLAWYAKYLKTAQ